MDPYEELVLKVVRAIAEDEDNHMPDEEILAVYRGVAERAISFMDLYYKVGFNDGAYNSADHTDRDRVDRRDMVREGIGLIKTKSE